MMNLQFRTSARTLLTTTLLLSILGTGVHAAEPVAVEVAIKDFKFLPAEITVKQGDRVRWTNREKRQYHSVWFEKSGDPEPDYLFPNDTYERTFEKPGVFPYRCGPHPEMTGTVTVE